MVESETAEEDEIKSLDKISEVLENSDEQFEEDFQEDNFNIQDPKLEKILEI